jgi:phosphorylase kinase alpha/beta subunit
MLNESYEILNKVRLPNHLYLASPSSDYSYFWIRDGVYMSLPFLDKNYDTFEKSIYALFDVFSKYEWKIDIHTKQKPKYLFEYIHSRYDMNGNEMNAEWGHAQHDAIGLFLFAVGKGYRHNKRVFRDDKDIRILQKLVYYLDTCEYWNDPDNGIWEEYLEVHASSVGAVLAGLEAVKDIVHVPEHMFVSGKNSLFSLLPCESVTKRVDLALLSLIYPYQLFDKEMSLKIIDNVEKYLLRERGVIRYEGDSYYSTLEKRYGRGESKEFYYGSEAEWCFGFPFLALSYYTVGNMEKAKYYLEKTESIMLADAVIPELYYSKTNIPNPNTPLGWCSAMYILAKEKIK